MSTRHLILCACFAFGARAGGHTTCSPIDESCQGNGIADDTQLLQSMVKISQDTSGMTAGSSEKASNNLPPFFRLAKTVALRGGRKDKYCTWNAGNWNLVKCSSQTRQTFEVVDAGYGKIALKCANGLYWSDRGTEIKCDQGLNGAWEKFTIQDVGNGKIALRSGRPGNTAKYCRDDSHCIRCHDRTTRKGHETFTVEVIDQPKTCCGSIYMWDKDDPNGIPHQPNRDGVFSMVGDKSAGGMPVYRNGDNQYLFYMEGGIRKWGIGNDYKSTSLGVKSQAGNAGCPDTFSTWQYTDGSSWRNKRITATCHEPMWFESGVEGSNNECRWDLVLRGFTGIPTVADCRTAAKDMDWNFDKTVSWSGASRGCIYNYRDYRSQKRVYFNTHPTGSKPELTDDEYRIYGTETPICYKAGYCTATVFKHRYFSKNGWWATFQAGDYSYDRFLQVGAVNDAVSSIKVVGSGCRATLFEHGDFSGWSVTFNEGSYDANHFPNEGIDDQASAIKVFGH